MSRYVTVRFKGDREPYCVSESGFRDGRVPSARYEGAMVIVTDAYGGERAFPVA